MELDLSKLNDLYKLGDKEMEGIVEHRIDSIRDKIYTDRERVSYLDGKFRRLEHYLQLFEANDDNVEIIKKKDYIDDKGAYLKLSNEDNELIDYINQYSINKATELMDELEKELEIKR